MLLLLGDVLGKELGMGSSSFPPVTLADGEKRYSGRVRKFFFFLPQTTLHYVLLREFLFLHSMYYVYTFVLD